MGVSYDGWKILQIFQNMMPAVRSMKGVTNMISGAGIVGLLSCLLCAVPFFIIGIFGKESSTPISFWSGDQTLKDKVTDLKTYNARMAKLYQKAGTAFCINGLCCFIFIPLGILGLVFLCTVGFYLFYRSYKQILEA